MFGFQRHVPVARFSFKRGLIGVFSLSVVSFVFAGTAGAFSPRNPFAGDISDDVVMIAAILLSLTPIWLHRRHFKITWCAWLPLELLGLWLGIGVGFDLSQRCFGAGHLHRLFPVVVGAWFLFSTFVTGIMLFLIQMWWTPAPLGSCRMCGYHLIDPTAVCPECGHVAPEAARAS